MALENFPYKMNKTAISVASLYDESDEKEYWISQIPLDRLLALEFLRQIGYGYNRASARLQRAFAASQIKTS